MHVQVCVGVEMVCYELESLTPLLKCVISMYFYADPNFFESDLIKMLSHCLSKYIIFHYKVFIFQSHAKKKT